MNSPIKTGIYMFIGIVLALGYAAAETKYVTEDLTITFRTGPGSDRKIQRMLPSGRSVEVVTPGDEWSEVRLANGDQGWVLTRYLTSKEPAFQKLERLQQKHARVLAKNEELVQSINELSAENKRLTDELDITQTNLSELDSAHKTLKSESTEFLKLKAKYEKVVKESSASRAKAEKIEKEYQQLYSTQVNTGMLYGGGLLLLGLILGFILKRPKRRSPLM